MVSVMGDEAQQNLSLRGLQNSAGFLQAKIAAKIETRYIPKLRFVLDQGVKNVLAVGEILHRIRQEKAAEAAAETDGEASESSPPPADDGVDDPGRQSPPPA